MQLLLIFTDIKLHFSSLLSIFIKVEKSKRTVKNNQFRIWIIQKSILVKASSSVPYPDINKSDPILEYY